jgi:hypothetical protein
MTVTATDPKRRAGLGKFVPPDIQVGDTVWWYQRGLMNNSPLPAIVVQDNGSAVLTLFIINRDGGWVYQGGRHANDPGLSDSSMTRYGCWMEREKT